MCGVTKTFWVRCMDFITVSRLVFLSHTQAKCIIEIFVKGLWPFRALLAIADASRARVRNRVLARIWNWVPKIGNCKLFGAHNFKGDHNILIISTINMHKFIKIRHDILIQCHGNYMEMKKLKKKTFHVSPL